MKVKNQLTHKNAYTMLLWRLFVVMALFSLQRLLFYWFNIGQFPEVSGKHLWELMVSGLKFDLTAVLYINILYILLMVLPIPFKYNSGFKKFLKPLFIISNSLGFMANLMDFVYFRYTLRRTDFGVFTEFQNEGQFFKIILTGMGQYWYLTLLFVLLVVILIMLYGDHHRSKLIKSSFGYYLASSSIMLITIWLTIVGIRGGFDGTTRPITISNANEKVASPIETAIVLNTPFSVFKTISSKRLQTLDYFKTNDELEKVYSPFHQGAEKGSFRAENVVVLILESFTKEVVGALNHDLEGGNYKGYTPFLDSLIQHSYTWEFSYANGQKSIDAIPSVIAGIPSLVQPFALSKYSLNDIEGLAVALKRKGYSSAFFHGAPNGSMGFDAMTNMLSVDKYFGMNEYGKKGDSDGFWGIPDQLFLQYCAHTFGQLSQPFFTSVFTLSSHHPYKVPAPYENSFKGGVNPLYRTIEYSDMSLRQFFETASKTDWYKNTLFVITADHSLPSSDHDKYISTIGAFSVPIIFYRPDDSLAGFDTSLVQQMDIFPTVLGYLNYDEPYFAFGRNRFDTNEKPFAINYVNGIYQFLEDDFLIQFDGKKLVGVFDYKKDITLKNNLLNSNQINIDKIFLRLKAFLQQYNNRMIENKLRYNGQ